MSAVPVVGVGAGGHAAVLIEALRLMGGYDVSALLDADPSVWGRDVCGVRVVGGDDRLEALRQGGVAHAVIGVGSVGSPARRRALYERVRAAGFTLVTVIHPAAVVSPSARLGQGVMVFARAVINARARVGDNVIVNTGAVVEHDCDVGSHAHVATGACLCSTVRVGDGAHIGAGSVVRQCVRIGRDAIIGAGAVVVRDVAEESTVIGVPARSLPETAGAPRQ